MVEKSRSVKRKCEKRHFSAATAPFPKSRASYFRFARFNTFPIYYLRAWHRLINDQLGVPSLLYLRNPLIKVNTLSMWSLWTIKCAAGTFDKHSDVKLRTIMRCRPCPVVCILVTLLFSTLLHVVTRLWAVSFLQSLQWGECTREENRVWFLSSRKKRSTHKVTVIYLMLSPPLRPLCLVRRLGRGKNESARWTMGRGKRGSEALPTSHRPQRALYFFYYCYFFGDTQREPLRRIEYLTQLLTLNLHVEWHADE